MIRYPRGTERGARLNSTAISLEARQGARPVLAHFNGRKAGLPHPWIGRCCLLCLGLALFSLSLFAPVEIMAQDEANSCVDCHQDSRLLVRNKKLYDYFQNWRVSIHGDEGVLCSDCHGGNSKARDKKAAHKGGVMGASEATSPISFQNIPATCAKCHLEIVTQYRRSEHFAHLKDKTPDEQGPNCVTCHGSVRTSVLNVNSVRTACAQCHNKAHDNHPEIPGQAEVLLNRFLSIDRFYRYIGRRGEPAEIKALFTLIDPMIERLNEEWHAFDLERIEKQTWSLLEYLREKRLQIKNRPVASPAKP